MATLTRTLSIAGVLALLAVLGFAAPAFAHNYYISSTPGVNEVLTTLPDQFIVTTNDNLLDLGGSGGGFFIEVTGPDGLYYGDGCVSVAGPSVTMPAAIGPAGEYKLVWQVVSADGHTVSGTVPFSWQPTAGAESTTQGSTSVPDCGGKVKVDQGAAADPGGKSDGAANADVLWVGGAIVALAIAAIAILMLLLPKKKETPISR